MSSSFGLQTGVSTSSRHRESLQWETGGKVSVPLTVFIGPNPDESCDLHQETLTFLKFCAGTGAGNADRMCEPPDSPSSLYVNRRF